MLKPCHSSLNLIAHLGVQVPGKSQVLVLDVEPEVVGVGRRVGVRRHTLVAQGRVHQLFVLLFFPQLFRVVKLAG